jgi:hypothetical protein
VEGLVNQKLASSRYIARETAVSAAINAAISVGFFMLVFRGIDPVTVWGVGNYAFDFIPQSFAIGFMATLVPGLLCRRAIAANRFAETSSAVPSPASVGARAALNGIAALVVGAGLCALVLWIMGIDEIDRGTAFVAKVLYGAALGALVTRLTLRRMLA